MEMKTAEEFLIESDILQCVSLTPIASKGAIIKVMENYAKHKHEQMLLDVSRYDVELNIGEHHVADIDVVLDEEGLYVRYEDLENKSGE